jgi:hypothetical protein
LDARKIGELRRSTWVQRIPSLDFGEFGCFPKGELLQFSPVLMEIKYTIAGADGQTYGPVTQQELQSWIRDGRVAAQTNVMRSDLNAWHVAAQYQELSFAGATTPPSLTSATFEGAKRPFAADPELVKKMKNGAGWFYWIAGLSMINGVIALFSGKAGGFLFSLWSVFYCAGIGIGIGGTIGTVIGFVLVAFLCGLFVLSGIFANKGHTWAFFLGLSLYILDSLILLVPPQNWLSLAFHAFACYSIFVGLKANLELKKQTGI